MRAFHSSVVVLGLCGALGCTSTPDGDSAPAPQERSATTESHLGNRFPVTANGSQLYAGGEPFLYLADTAWMLPAAASDSDAETYLAKRASQGFTVIQMYLTRWGGDCNPDDNGYWSHVDTIVGMARAHGLVVSIDPGEAASLGARYGSQAYCLGERASRQLAHYDNVMWFVGGDESPSTAGLDNTRAMVNGIREHDASHIISFHGALDANVPGNALAGYAPILGEGWLGFTMSYDASYFYGSRQNYVMTYGLRGRGLPIVLAESEYEGMFSALEVRQPHYWSLFAGGVGGAFGNVSTMNMLDAPGWLDALDSPGAWQMSFLRTFATKYPWFKYVPDNSVVTGGGGTYGQGDFVTAAVANDDSFIVAYLPTSRSLTVKANRLGTSVDAQWFDPTTGVFTTVNGSPFDTTNPVTLPAPPTSGGDMVLALTPASGGGGGGGARLEASCVPNTIYSADNQVLDARGVSSANGTRVQVWKIHGNVNQYFAFAGDGSIRGMDNTCLDVSGIQTADNTPVQLWQCWGGPNEQWSYHPDGTIRGLAGKCLDLEGGGTADGTGAVLYTCNGSASQQWRVCTSEGKFR